MNRNSRPPPYAQPTPAYGAPQAFYYPPPLPQQSSGYPPEKQFDYRSQQLATRDPRFPLDHKPPVDPSQFPSLHAKSASSMNTVNSGDLLLHHYATSAKTNEIYGPDKRTLLYTYRRHNWSKPSITLHAPNGQEIGSITMHSLSSKIDTTLHGRHFTLVSNGLFRSGHHYISQAGMGTLKWKNDGLSSSKVLMNTSNQKVARFGSSSWSAKYEGRFTIMAEGLKQGPALDELVLTLLAELETDKRNATAANGAEAGVAAAGAGGGGG